MTRRGRGMAGVPTLADAVASADPGMRGLAEGIVASLPACGRPRPGMALTRALVVVGEDVGRAVLARGAPVALVDGHRTLVAMADAVVVVDAWDGGAAMQGVARVAPGAARPTAGGLARSIGETWLSDDEMALRGDPASGDAEVAAYRDFATDVLTALPGGEWGMACTSVGRLDVEVQVARGAGRVGPEAVRAALSFVAMGLRGKRGWGPVGESPRRFASGWAEKDLHVAVEPAPMPGGTTMGLAARAAAAARARDVMAAVGAPAGLVAGLEAAWRGEGGVREGRR